MNGIRIFSSGHSLSMAVLALALTACDGELDADGFDADGFDTGDHEADDVAAELLDGERLDDATDFTAQLDSVASTCGVLASGETLSAGNVLVDCTTSRHFLNMQTDGNLVAYWDNLDGTFDVLWESNTYGSGANRVVMQGDGNLVMYTAGDVAVWNSGTSGNPGAQLYVETKTTCGGWPYYSCGPYRDGRISVNTHQYLPALVYLW